MFTNKNKNINKNKFIIESNEKEKSLEYININQNGKCLICSGELKLDNNTNIIKTECSHYYHYNCLYMAYKFNRNVNYNHNKIRVCPYCRYNTGFLPLIYNYNPEKYIHKEFINSSIITCDAILKSGKRKGNKCGCRIRNTNLNYCGKHKNYKPPNIEKEKDEEKEKEDINKILLTYL
tara:strand:- start:99 stop:632 length:534 start_codon:yes stop_codon:yes gene_type:complete